MWVGRPDGKIPAWHPHTQARWRITDDPPNWAPLTVVIFDTTGGLLSKRIFQRCPLMRSCYFGCYGWYVMILCWCRSFISLDGVNQVVSICVYIYIYIYVERDIMILYGSQVHKEKNTCESVRWCFCRSAENVYEHIWTCFWYCKIHSSIRANSKASIWKILPVYSATCSFPRPRFFDMLPIYSSLPQTPPLRGGTCTLMWLPLSSPKSGFRYMSNSTAKPR